MPDGTSSIGNWIAFGALVVAIPGAVVALVQLDVFDNGGSSGPTVEATSEGADDRASASPVVAEDPEAPTTEEPPPSGDIDVGNCMITVDHIGAVIRQEPDHLSQELASVPSGDYEPLAARQVTWAGLIELWYQIEVDGRTGWTVYSTILVPAKSSGCP